MHELFLTAQIASEDLDRSLRILQGYCGMKPVPLLRRRLIFEGPRSRQLHGIDPTFIAKQGLKVALWRSLHEQITRQSYILTVIYDVEKEMFGKGTAENETGGDKNEVKVEGNGSPMDCDQNAGTLRWNDLPDPAGARPVNSRLILNIDGEKNLCQTMKSMHHRFQREMIQECYRFVYEDIVFDLSRYLQIPEGNDVYGGISTRLPPFEALNAFDGENKWILTANVGVLNGNDPTQMQKGVDELVAVKMEFEGCFDFQALERHIFDTRVKF